MRLSNRVDASKPRDWEITMKSFQQYRIDYLERLVRGHICLWPEGSQEVKHLSWKQGWGKYKFSPVVLVFAVTIACRDISSESLWVWGMCFERAPVAQWSYEIEGKHCESKTFKVHNYLKRMLTAALAVRYLFWKSCCGKLPVLIRKHQLQMLEIQKKPFDDDVESNRECERFVLKEVLWQSDKSMHKELTTGRPSVKTTAAVKNYNNSLAMNTLMSM